MLVKIYCQARLGLRFSLSIIVPIAVTLGITAPKEAGAQGPKPNVRSAEVAGKVLAEVGRQEIPLSDKRSTTASQKGPQPPLHLLGETLAPGTTKRLFWTAGQTFEGEPVSTPILVVNGHHPGPILCLTAAIHGDELNGIMTVHRLMEGLKPDRLNGAVVGAPLVNLHGYRRNTRYLPDRRDLNRHFPGSANGSTASRIAYSFFQEVVASCNVLVDFHTGSFHRTNLPQVRVDFRYPEAVKLARGFGGITVVHKKGSRGTLRRAATEADIPALTFEAGKPKRLQPQAVEAGLQGIKALMKKLGMIDEAEEETHSGKVFSKAKWVRTRRAGILVSEVRPGDAVRVGQRLGVTTDPTTNQETAIVSPYEGCVLGMALNQVTMPGFAAYHIGIGSGEVGEDAD
jgi:uncharacterized protein